MRQILILALSCINIGLSAQYGLRITYNNNTASEWNSFFSGIERSDVRVFNQSFSLVADYWLRLPNKRIEFYPYISFHQASSTLNISDVNLGIRQFGSGIIAHIYFLDFLGDCDCPTFSKEGNAVKKGLFLLLNAGVDYTQKSVDKVYNDGNLDFKIAAGLGFDIGLNDFITLSPFAQMTYYPDISWHDMAIQFGQEINNVNSSFRMLQFGIRVGFRPDYLNK